MSVLNDVMDALVKALQRIQDLATDNKPCDEFYALAAIVKECQDALSFWDNQAARKRALDQLVADAQAMGPYE